MLINTRRVKVSRRAAFLALFGVVYVLIGYSYLNIPARYKPLLHAQFRFALDLAPIEFYGWAWIACGGLAAVGGAWHRLDGLGFAAGVFMPYLWSTVSFIASIQDGVPRAWVGGVVYLAFGTAMWIISGVPDPLDVARGSR